MICLILRSQHLCFAVARIFARCVRAPDGAGELPPKARSSLLLVILPEGQAHGAWYGIFPGASFRGSAFCISNGLGPVESV